MPQITFLPVNETFEVAEGFKILVCAVRNKINIQYGCGSARCGTCGVKISGDCKLSEMTPAETELLQKMGLPLDGEVRLACQTKILSGSAIVDLDYQLTYSPDDRLED